MSKRPRKQPYPKKFSKPAKKKAKAKREGPLWTRPDDTSLPLHPEIDRQLAKPFLATIYLDAETESFRYPVPNNMPAKMDGIHTRMLRHALPFISFFFSLTFQALLSRYRAAQGGHSEQGHHGAAVVRSGGKTGGSCA
jgi:hypothetical protein